MILKSRTYGADGALVDEHDVDVPDPPAPATDALRAKVSAATNTTTLKAAVLEVLDLIDADPTSP